jgi:phosphatidate cytidylyltransferase
MKRVITAAIGIPIVLVATIYAPGWLFALMVAFFAAAALDEFLSLGATRGLGRPGRWLLPVGAAVTASFIGGLTWVLFSLAMSAILLMSVASTGKPVEIVMGKLAAGLAGILYCCVLLGFLVLIPREALLLLFSIVWVGDSAAYYGGRAFGRHLLAPTVSPKKTVEGAVAGLAGSVMAGAIVAAQLLGEPWFWGALISGITAIAGQVGDLAESAVKRSAGVKDSSSILPGHGGILDRLDSLFFAAPVFYYLLQVRSS